jgi:ParB family transcriptional regulator, chromosome partitioning protein
MLHKAASTGTDLTVDGAVTYDTKFIPLSDIKIPANRMRSRQREEVDRLAESFQEVGQLQPIVVRSVAGADHTYWLVLGERRLEAARKLRWDTIRADVVEGLDADRLELAEIDENLMRGELSPSERGAHQAKRKEIYERLYPETKAGGDRKSKSQNEILKEPAYIDDTAAKTGSSRSTVGRDANRGKKIPDIAALAGTSLDTGVELDALAKLPVDQQAALVEQAKAGKKVSARPSEAVKAEREAKRRDKHKKKHEERQTRDRVQREEEEKAREERALLAVEFLREHLKPEQLVQFVTLVEQPNCDGYWNEFGKVLEREIKKPLEEGNAAPSGIATDIDPSTELMISDTDAPKMFVEIDSGLGPEPAAQDELKEIANVDSEEGADP